MSTEGPKDTRTEESKIHDFMKMIASSNKSRRLHFFAKNESLLDNFKYEVEPCRLPSTPPENEEEHEEDRSAGYKPQR